MSGLLATTVRWRNPQTGVRLVALAVKPAEGGLSIVLPVEAGCQPHPLDWMPEASFRREYEQEPVA